MIIIYIKSAIKWLICNVDHFLTGVAIIVSVLLALLIQYLNKRRDQKKKRNELNLYKQMITSFVEYSKDNIITNIVSIKSFSEKIESSDSLDIENLSYSEVDFSKIYSLPYEKISDALLINLNNASESSKYLYELITQLKAFINFSKQLDDIFKEYKFNIDQLSKHWNTTFVPLSMNITDSLKKVDGKEKEFYEFGKMQFAKFNKEHRQRIVNHSGNINASLTECVDTCIKPLIEYYKKNQEVQSSDLVEETMKLIHSVFNIFIQHEIYKKTYSQIFLCISHQMEISKTVLFEVVEFYKSHEIKSSRKIRL